MNITSLDLGKVVYIMAPMTIYQDEKQYLQPIKTLREHFPHLRFLLPDRLYTSNADWRANFAKQARKAKSALLLTNQDGTIGRGCWDEMHWFLSRSKPVWHVNVKNGDLKFFSTFHLEILPFDDWRRYARVSTATAKAGRRPSRRRSLAVKESAG